MDDLSITPISDSACSSYLSAAARRLCCGNMLATYKRHGMSWDEELFSERWQDNENYAIRINGEWVGFISLKALPDILYLRDLQLVPHWQGRGVGSACLNWLIQLATQQEYGQSLMKDRASELSPGAQPCPRALRLRVFSNSPALALYQRHGFTLVNEQCTPTRSGSIMALERPLAFQTAPTLAPRSDHAPLPPVGNASLDTIIDDLTEEEALTITAKRKRQSPPAARNIAHH
ncbi:GNAT family N-acetyltransferase [Cobetia sp. AM6]|uniref:GNAT family N-acetyltransferase n=1 Tax=Cobetia sp. AM6 TaxID=2661553 RepID=UPI001299090B|nr:GNAT family N-acetyltransferase [Cobetia sp. AM6]BBO56202.1 hypothetical protein CLAM6_15130 [Cobetia sp. AM6]